MTHTPGPWHLSPSGKANVLGLYTVFYGHGETPHNQICQAEEADARLIAAAPELLGILQATMPMLQVGKLIAEEAGDHAALKRFDETAKAVRAAIAKAEGK